MLPGAPPGLVLAASARLRAALEAWGLRPEDLRLLAAVDGTQDLPGTAGAAGLDPRDAAPVAGRLLAAGLVDLVPGAAPLVLEPDVEPAPAQAPPLPLALPEEPAPAQAPPLRLALPEEPAARPAPAGPGPQADDAPASPAPDTDTAALLRELSLLHVTRPVAPLPAPPAVVPPPTAVAPPPGAAAPADRRKRGLFGRG